MGQENSSNNSFSGEGDVARLCAYLEAVAASERVLLVSPEVFGRVGLVQGGLGDGADANVVFEPSARVTAGIRYSFNDLVRGNGREDLALAECQAARATAKIESFVEANEEIDETAAYTSQLVAVESALADARRILATTQRKVDSQRATELELRALRARINRYEGLAHDLRIRIAAAREEETVTVEAELETLVAEVVDSEVAAERERSDLRTDAAWDLQVAGGYDQTFGFDSELPVFATMSFAWNFGRLWQGAHEDDAIASRRAMFAERENSWDKQLDEVAERLERIALAETAKLRDVRAMLADIRARREEMLEIGTETSERYAAQLELDAWDLEIERAYLYDHIRLLAERLRKLGKEVPQEVEAALEVSDVEAVEPKRIEFTNGKSEPVGKAAVRVDQPKARAYFAESTGESGKLTFTYEGPTSDTTKLGSGAVRRQIGLKLRARDSCNLLYVMWRIEPPEGVVVSVKRNEGESLHAQCGNSGYTNLEPDTTAEVLPVEPGSQHTLEAELEGETLVVRADGKIVWRGDVPTGKLPEEGVTGIRTDNGVFTIFGEAPRATAAR